MNKSVIKDLLYTEVQYGKVLNPTPEMIKLFKEINWKPRTIDYHYNSDEVYYIEDLNKEKTNG